MELNNPDDPHGCWQPLPDGARIFRISRRSVSPRLPAGSRAGQPSLHGAARGLVRGSAVGQQFVEHSAEGGGRFIGSLTVFMVSEPYKVCGLA